MEGKKFGKFTVFNLIKIDKPGKHYECMCECGNFRIKSGTELRAGRGLQCRECQYEKLYDPQKEIGKKYGKWTIIEYLGIHRKLQQFKCQCECGKIGTHVAADLRAGKSTQCINCHNRKCSTKHGMHDTKTYKIWSSMLHRCSNPNASFYNRYGARGIKVCDRWQKFENFFSDMGEKPENMEIDRINNDGNYEPSNCRWVSHKENCNNRANKKNKRGPQNDVTS